MINKNIAHSPLKRLTLIALIVVLLISLVGCKDSSPSDENKIEDIPLDRRIGVIKSLGGAKTSSNGTHLLQLDDGDTILLKSVAINLDDKRYSDATVEIRGVLTYTKGEKPLMEVVNIDILEDYVSSDDKSSKWEDFESSEFEFSIFYRNDFDIDESSSGVTFKIPSEEDEFEMAPFVAEVSISTETKKEDENIFDYLNLESDSPPDLLDKGMTKSKVGSQNIDAFKKVGNNSMIDFYVDSDKYFYTISFKGDDDAESAKKNENLFFEMLSTFTLTGQLASDEEDLLEDEELHIDSKTIDDNWLDENGYYLNGTEDVEQETIEIEDYASFESENFDFSFQYPQSWYFEGSVSNEPGVTRHYEFGDEPLEESAGDVYLDVVSTGAAAGEAVNYGGKKFTKVQDGNNVEIYYEGDIRIYRISGPASKEDILLQMASTVDEN
jgi:hypothetical protein